MLSPDKTRMEVSRRGDACCKICRIPVTQAETRGRKTATGAGLKPLGERLDGGHPLRTKHLLSPHLRHRLTEERLSGSHSRQEHI